VTGFLFAEAQMGSKKFRLDWVGSCRFKKLWREHHETEEEPRMGGPCLVEKDGCDPALFLL